MYWREDKGKEVKEWDMLWTPTRPTPPPTTAQNCKDKYHYRSCFILRSVRMFVSSSPCLSHLCNPPYSSSSLLMLYVSLSAAPLTSRFCFSFPCWWSCRLSCRRVCVWGGGGRGGAGASDRRTRGAREERRRADVSVFHEEG
jgi:hypothetical protein